MSINKRLCVVIINYKTPILTIDCIHTLHDQVDRHKDHIVVVDNNSGGNDATIIDESVRRAGLSDLVSLVSAHENNGFSSGNNIGIRTIVAEFYVLANADTLFRSNAIHEMLEAANKYPKAGIISPRLEWPDGEPQISCFKFPSPFSELIHSAGTGVITGLFRHYNVPLPVVDQATRPDWTSFACVMIPRKMFFEKVGLLDQGYFMYFEDVDFCRRVWKAGYEIINWPFAKVVHLRGQSSGMKKLEKEKQRLPDYYYRSRSRYFSKFYGNTGWFCANLCWLAGRCVSWLREIIMKKSQTVPENQFFDIWKR